MGIKQSRIRKCGMCGRGIMECGSQIFYIVEVKQCILDLRAIARQNGLEMMLGGNAAIANAMGPNEDLAKEMFAEEKWICFDCSLKNTMVAVLAEEEGK